MLGTNQEGCISPSNAKMGKGRWICMEGNRIMKFIILFCLLSREKAQSKKFKKNATFSMGKGY